MKKLCRPIHWEGEKIKGSRFIVDAAPALKTEACEEFVSTIRQEQSNATHCCFAWRLSPSQFRQSDAGEPRGSAGLPILRRLESMDIVETVCVVTRYFGGVKLGVGGLIRAYGGAAGMALEKGVFQDAAEKCTLVFTYEYSDSRLVLSALAQMEDLEVKQEYGLRIKAAVKLPLHLVSAFQENVQEKCSGRIVWLESA